MAETIREQIRKGQYLEATDTWNGLENAIGLSSNNVVSDYIPIIFSLESQIFIYIFVTNLIN